MGELSLDSVPPGCLHVCLSPSTLLLGVAAAVPSQPRCERVCLHVCVGDRGLAWCVTCRTLCPAACAGSASRVLTWGALVCRCDRAGGSSCVCAGASL